MNMDILEDISKNNTEEGAKNDKTCDCNNKDDSEKGIRTSKANTNCEILNLAKETKKDKDTELESKFDHFDQNRTKNLRFGIDVILKENGSVNKKIPLNFIDNQRSFKSESDDCHKVVDNDLSDRESDANIDNEFEDNDVVTSRSSLAVLGLHPQLSVLIRSNNSVSFGSDMSFYPPSLQMGTVGLHWSSVNDVRKDRFGCK